MPAKTALHVIAKRPGALGLKDKQREQRKKILKMCVQKLRDIDDPETVLCRAVLINNTFKTLKYAQRKMQLKKSEMKRHPVVEEEDSRDHDEENQTPEEEEETPTSDNEVESNADNIEESVSSAYVTSPEPTFDHKKDMDDLSESNCDINSYNAESIVHSLVMPPLLSPQLEDMTNCSFYDNFTNEEDTHLGLSQHSQSSHLNLSQSETIEAFSDKRDTLNGSLKLAMMKTDLCDVISESNSNTCQSAGAFDFSSKVDLPNCASVSSDIGDSLLIDNLLTEIVQA